MKNKIWLSSPHMGGGEMKYIKEAFDENWIAPLGPNVNGFEKDIETYLGEDVHVAALSSGTAALHLALIMLNVKKDDFVICQSLTFAASANAISYLGAKPVFVDSEIQTWNLCPNALEDAIKNCISKGKKPKAIMAVSLYGMPYKVDEITVISKKYEIPVIEDSAEALGSSYKGQKMGTFGDISIISFNGNKIITTSGGGALISKNQKIKEKAIFLSTQAKDDAPHYEHTTIGYNYRMSNISAGIGRGQMEVLEERIQQRRANHFFYKNLFEEIKGVTLLKEPSDDFFSNHWLTAIQVHQDVSGICREQLRLKLLEENIEARPIWKPMHLQPVFTNEKYFGNHVAEIFFKTGLCLPSGTNMSDLDRERIAEVITKVFTK